MSQNITIEIRTQGRNTIPLINSGNIVTIHGKNGVGKSMAATMLEIASGNYTFESEGRFNKLVNIIQSCEIQLKENGDLLYKAELKPHLWHFEKNLNRINPRTLGDYFKGEKRREKEIQFEEFKKNVYVRTIRGNESLQQQIFFFKDVLVAKIGQKLEKLEQKIEFLDKYQVWINKNELEKLLNNYSKYQEKYNKDLNKISNFDSSISNRTASLNNFNQQLEILNKLIFIAKNELEKLVKKSSGEEEKLKNTKNEREDNYKKLSNIEQKLKEIETQFDQKTTLLIKKLAKLRNKKEVFKKNLVSQFDIELESADKNNTSNQMAEINKNIDSYQARIKMHKENIEKLNKENKRILKINNILSQLREICSKASSTEFKRETLML